MGKLWLSQFLQSFCSQESDMFAWAEVLPSIPNSRVVKWRQILDSCVFLISGSRLYEASRRGPSFKLDRPAILGMVLSSARHRPSERTWKKGPKFLECFWTQVFKWHLFFLKEKKTHWVHGYCNTKHVANPVEVPCLDWTINKVHSWKNSDQSRWTRCDATKSCHKQLGLWSPVLHPSTLWIQVVYFVYT